jgi:hypothetical protein
MKKLKIYFVLSLLITVLGLLLLGYMIFVEGEPGALPLALVILGSSWHVFTRIQIRSRRQSLNEH